MTEEPIRSPESTRERILDAALSVFSHKGYHDARLDEIVAESKTSKGSIYFHFPNKERLFLALVEKFADLVERRVTEAIERQTSPMAKVEAALEACLEEFGRYRRPAKVMLVQATGLGTVFEEKRLEINERFANLIRIYLNEAVAAGEIDEVDTDVIAYAWLGSIYYLTIRWVYSGEPEPSRIVGTLVPMLLQSVNYTRD
jgi:AcrR family transcriptional regulator